MAYHPILQALGYQPPQKQPFNLFDMLIRNRQQGNADREAGDLSAQREYDLAQAKELSDLVNPIRNAELRGMQPSQNAQPAPQAPAMPAAPQPQGAPTDVQQAPQGANGLPYYISAALKQQQPQAPANVQPDPYAGQQATLDERKAALADADKKAMLYATVPVLAAVQKNRMANLAGREDLAKDQFGIAQNREWEAIKPTLDKIMTPPVGGWDPLKGDKAEALARAQAAVPAHLQDLPKVKDWFAVAGKEPQNSMVMAGVGGRIGTSLMTDFRGERKEYEDKTNGYLNAEGIVKASTFGKSRIGDISLLDQMARAETGSKPTEAQYHEFKDQPGILGKIGALHERVINGRLLNPEDVDAIMEELRSQQAIRHENFASTVKTFNQQARDLGVNTAFVNPGGIYQQVESTWKPSWGHKEGDNSGAGKTVWRKDKSGKLWEYDATTKQPTGRSK